MKPHQVYKAYLSGMDVTQLAHATGYSYAAIDQIIQQNKAGQQMHGLFQESTSSLRKGSAPVYGRTGLSARAAQVVSNRESLQAQSPITPATQAAIKEAVQQIRSSEFRSATTDDLIDALFALDLVKDIPWLNKRQEGGISAAKQRQQLKAPVHILLPLVQEGKLTPADMASALKSPNAEIASESKARWSVSTPKSFDSFKNSLSSLDKRRVSRMMELVAEQARLFATADAIQSSNATEATRLKAEGSALGAQYASLRAELLASAAVKGINVDLLELFLQYKQAAVRLVSTAAYEPTFVGLPLVDTNTAAIAAVIADSTGEPEPEKPRPEPKEDLNASTDVTSNAAPSPSDVADAADSSSDKADATALPTKPLHKQVWPYLTGAGLLALGLYFYRR